jgi:hypothetical protein
VLGIDTISGLSRCVILHIDLLNFTVPSERVLNLAQLDAFQGCKKLDEDRARLL